MSSLAVVLGFLIMSIWLGRRMQRVTFGSYCLITVFAVLQVLAILIYVYTLESPAL